jgi:hypothetical protein
LVVIIQYGEGERCNSNDLFNVQIYEAMVHVNDEISSQMEDGELDEIKMS